MKYLVFTLFFSFFQLFYAQENDSSNVKLIQSFLKDLFDDSVNAQKVVDEYIYANTYYMGKSKDSTIDGSKIAKNHIIEIRKSIDLDKGWLMPNHRVSELKDKVIVPLSQVDSLDNMRMSKLEDKKYIYALLDSKKKEILQYFLVKNNKILSFSLFVKGKTSWFFNYSG